MIDEQNRYTTRRRRERQSRVRDEEQLIERGIERLMRRQQRNRRNNQ